jgi:hypothetical protein
MRPIRGAFLLALAAFGCDAAIPPPADTPPAAPRSPLITPHSSLAGRVVFAGPPPLVMPVTAYRILPTGAIAVLTHPSPNKPAIGGEGGLGGAVVFLRGIDPATARAWDRPPVTVEMHDERPMVRQGDGPPSAIGFVRRGDEVTIVSRQTLFHSLRVRGAAFWSLTLPDPDRPRTRRLDRPGVVELSSGVNYFWMHGYLWVCEHPYYTLTDAAGRWEMSGVPAGTYDLVVWLPNWRTERQERDPETGMVARYVFRPPLEVTRPVTVREGEPVAVGDVVITSEPRTK